MAQIFDLGGSNIPNQESNNGSLEVLDELREKFINGDVAAFFCVTINKDDSTSTFSGWNRLVRELEAIGAITRLQYAALTGHLREET